MRHTDIEAFIAARSLDPALLAAAAGVTPQDLENLLVHPNREDEAARRVRRCADEWQQRLDASFEGLAILLEAGDEVWELFRPSAVSRSLDDRGA